MLFDLDFANNTIHHASFFFSFLKTYTFLIPVVLTQIFTPIAELVVPIEILTKEVKAEIEKHPVIVEIKISECSI